MVMKVHKPEWNNLNIARAKAKYVAVLHAEQRRHSPIAVIHKHRCRRPPHRLVISLMCRKTESLEILAYSSVFFHLESCTMTTVTLVCLSKSYSDPPILGMREFQSHLSQAKILILCPCFRPSDTATVLCYSICTRARAKKEGFPVSFCFCGMVLSPFAHCYFLLVVPSFTVSSPWTKLPTMELGKICAGQASSFIAKVKRGNTKSWTLISFDSMIRVAMLKAAMWIPE